MKPAYLLPALAFAASSCASAQTFDAPKTVDVDGEIYGSRVADLDGDGNNEALYFSGYASDDSKNGTLYVADADSGGVFSVRASARLADSYLNRSALAVATGPEGRAYAVAGANSRLWSVSWDGATFVSRPLTTAIANESLIAVDLDEDGVDEIVSQSWNAGAAVYGFTPSGALVERYRFATAARGYNDLGAGDINNDGHADVLVVNGQGLGDDAQVFYGNGAGQLGSPLSISQPGGDRGNGGGVGDVNGDGRDDVVLSVGRNSPTWIWAYIQDATGGLQAPVQVASHDIPADVLIADFDLDGFNEVAIQHDSWDVVGIYRTDALGIIPGEEFVPMWNNNLTFQALDAGDVDDDGCPDLVVSRGSAGGTWVRTRECVLPPPDTAPDAFAFASLSGVLRGSQQVSAAAVITGITASTPVEVSQGEVSINGGAFTSSAGTVQRGDSVTLRHVAAAGFDATTTTTVIIGGVTATFSSRTEQLDATPDAFTFIDHDGVATNVLQTSAAITVTGINVAASISIANGSDQNQQTVNPQYSVNGGPFVSAPGTVQPGDQVRVQQPSAVDANTPQHAVVTIGGVSDTFTSRTGSVDTTPTGFVFNDVIDAKRNKAVLSAPLTLSGFNTPVAISISGAGGTYALNNGAFTSAPGTARPGDRITLRLVAPNVSYATVSTTVTVGGISDTWNVRTGR